MYRMHKENLDKSSKLGHFVTSEAAVKLILVVQGFFFFLKTLKIHNYALKFTCFRKKEKEKTIVIPYLEI